MYDVIFKDEAFVDLIVLHEHAFIGNIGDALFGMLALGVPMIHLYVNTHLNVAIGRIDLFCPMSHNSSA